MSGLTPAGAFLIAVLTMALFCGIALALGKCLSAIFRGEHPEAQSWALLAIAGAVLAS